MNRAISKFSEITSLEMFDESAFLGDDKVPQDVCNFVLALACIYNDYKDTLLSLSYLEKVKPLGEFEETAEWGEFNGLKFHIIRIQVALIHELLKFLSENKSVVEDQFIADVVMQMDKKGKQSWHTLVNISQGNDDPHRIAKTLMMIRNKISFHYDPKEISKGYRRYYCDSTERKKAYISRGDKLIKERYYFADAASQNYFYSRHDNIGQEKFINILIDVMECIAPALSQVITRFIQKRGFAWQQVN